MIIHFAKVIKQLANFQEKEVKYNNNKEINHKIV